MDFKRIYYDFMRIKAVQLEIYSGGKLLKKIYFEDTGQDTYKSKKYGSFINIPAKSDFNTGLFKIVRYEANSITPYTKNEITIKEEDGGIKTVYAGVNPLDPKLLKAFQERDSLKMVAAGSKSLNDIILPVLIIGGFFVLMIVVIGVMFGGW